ncbi:hypothetical protein, partial [Pseudomonas corrugata]|uniref:hypothetical protein n=1 Tax=Pseudomonas corrugata TaxID=47879 RepID=UPI0019D7006B
ASLLAIRPFESKNLKKETALSVSPQAKQETSYISTSYQPGTKLAKALPPLHHKNNNPGDTP